MDCSGGKFSNPDGCALSLTSGKIDGSFRLTNGFSVAGRVEAGSASIGGNFICSDGSITYVDKNPRKATDEDPPVQKVEQKSGKLSIILLKIARRLKSLVTEPEKLQLREKPLIKKEDEPKHPGTNPPRSALEANQLRVGGSACLREGLEIAGGANMIGANIVGDLDCRAASFLNAGDDAFIAARIKIGRDAFFNESETDGLIVFDSAAIEGNLIFNGTRFLGEGKSGLILEVATVKRTLVWRNIEKAEKMILQLDDASVGRFLDDEESWPSEDKLSLFGFKYDRISGPKTVKARMRWVQLAQKGASLQPYEQLAAVMKAAGHDTAAKQVAIAREDARRLHSGLSWWVRCWKYFLKVTLGYGYAPRRALYWAVGMILLGWLLFGAGFQKSLFSPVADGIYRDPAYLQSARTLPSGYQTFNALVYSLDSFLPIIDLHQESKWLPNPTQKCIVLGSEMQGGKLIRIYLWIHIIAGWALTTLAVAGFTGVIRKE